MQQASVRRIEPDDDIRCALVVDPDWETRLLYRECLAFHRWSVMEAESGPEALAKAIGCRPGLIVSETRLPGFTGIALCQLLRRDVATHHVPFVFVTADVQPATLAKATQAGADLVLTKPCPPDQLLEGIRAAVVRTRRQQTEAVPLTQPREDERALTPAALANTSSRRTTLKNLHRRGETGNPPRPPPVLHCPDCAQLLQYLRSHIGGVSSKNAEQWDYFECRRCGGFEYRARTKKLRKQVCPPD